MKEIKTTIWVMILISSGLFGFILKIENVSASTTIDVDAGGTIQQAVNQARNGQDSTYIINILSTYNNNLETGTITIDWNVGNTPNSKDLIITGPPNFIVLNTLSNNMNIMNIQFNLPGKSITIQNLEFMAGHTGCTAIYSTVTNSIQIDNCITSSSTEVFDTGFYLDGVAEERIYNCDVTSFSDYGIRMDDCINTGGGSKGIIACGVDSNNNPYPGDGIYLDNCKGIAVQNNNIQNNNNGILMKGSENCYFSSESSSYCIDDNFDYGIIVDDTGISVESEKSRSNKFDNLYLEDNGYGGIKLLNCDLDTDSIYYNLALTVK